MKPMIKNKPYYDFVGRRLYIVFSDNVVVSMEKLNIDPAKLGLRNAIEKTPDGSLIAHHDGRGMKLVNVYHHSAEGNKCGVAEFITEEVGKPANTEAGRRIDYYFCEKSSWITQEEYDTLLNEHIGKETNEKTQTFQH